MKTIVMGVALAGTVVSIALVARDQFLEQAGGNLSASFADAAVDGSSTPDATRSGTQMLPAPVAQGADPATGQVGAGANHAGSAAPADVPAGSPEAGGGAGGTGTGVADAPGLGVGSPAGNGSELGTNGDPGSGTFAPAGDGSEPVAERPAAQEPDAETVLLRASAAYEAVRSLRADFVQHLENPLLGSETTSRGTLFQRRPDRFLMRFSDPEGDVIVSDGRYFWIYYPSVHEDQVIRTPASAGAAGGADLQAQFLGDPLERFSATLEGRAEVAGREAYVLNLVPRERAPYARLKVWVDAEDHLARRFEIYEDNGTVRRFELRNLTVNPSLDDALFQFTPPPGARVIDRG